MNLQCLININVNANQTPQPANMQNETPAENNSERQPDLQQNGKTARVNNPL